MRGLHVIYRQQEGTDRRWEARIPAETGVCHGMGVGADDGHRGVAAAGGASLTAVLTAARRRVGHEDKTGPGAVSRPARVVEHVEHAVARGVYLRQAFDEESDGRDRVARLIRACITDRRVLSGLSAAAGGGPGELVVVACVPTDEVAWVLEQYEHRPLVVATAVCNSRAWWNLLTDHPHPERTAPPGSLGELGLLDPYATVADWMVAAPAGAVLSPLAPAATSGPAPVAGAAGGSPVAQHAA